MTDVRDLVTIDDGVRGDDTMKEMYQLLRVDLVRGPTVKAQVLYSRIPKELYFSEKRKRMNVGYISYSNQGDLFKLARLCFAAGMALMFNGLHNIDLKNATRVQLHAQIPRIKELTESYMKGLK